MERLTQRYGDNGVELVNDSIDAPGVAETIAMHRLADYEDTGLTPTEINARLQRKHDCKIECLFDEYNKVVEERDALKERQRWIPVSERLPNENMPVLVCYIGYIDKKLYSDGTAYSEEGIWRWCLDDDKVAVIVTHWMPLPPAPEPPEEEQK